MHKIPQNPASNNILFTVGTRILHKKADFNSFYVDTDAQVPDWDCDALQSYQQQEELTFKYGKSSLDQTGVEKDYFYYDIAAPTYTDLTLITPRGNQSWHTYGGLNGIRNEDIIQSDISKKYVFGDSSRRRITIKPYMGIYQRPNSREIPFLYETRIQDHDKHATAIYHFRNIWASKAGWEGPLATNCASSTA